MSLSGLSLAQIRTRLREEQGDTRLLRRLGEELRCDRRAGARSLAAHCQRQLDRRRAESRRIARLFRLRRGLRRQGVCNVAGVDEVGMGPLAGPVVAAAVVLPERVDLPGLNDSKQLSARAREQLDQAIRAQALAVGIGEVPAQEIDRINIYRAGLEAMRRAVVALGLRPGHLLVDARVIPDVDLPQTAIAHGDAVDGSIAAASIVAKVHRDAFMARLDDLYPGYGFSLHRGYATGRHLEALRSRGPSPVHRRSFAPVARALQP